MENENLLDWPDDNESNAITMYDDDGQETNFQVLSAQEDNGQVYLLVEEMILSEDEDEDETGEAEVLHFKCVASDTEEMIFELVDEEHEDFEKVLALFKDDYKTLNIQVD